MTSLMRYDPFTSSLFRDTFNQVFSGFPWTTGFGGLTEGRQASAASVPADLIEAGDAFRVVLSLPGIDPQQLNVTIKEQVLTVSGTRENPTPGNNEQVLWRGIPYGPFQYAFALPAPVVPDQVEAVYEHGILRLTLPKAEQARSRQIQVQVGSGMKQLEVGAGKRG